MLAPLLLLVSSASALPTFKWTNGEIARYYVDTEIFWAKGLKAAARENLDTRIQDMHLQAEVDCKVTLRGKNAELDCTVPYMHLSASPDGDTQARVDKVMADWMEFAKPAKIFFTIGADGRMKEFDVNKLPDANSREGALSEQMRMFLRVALSPLDITLTTDDKDWIRGWQRKDIAGPLLLPVADSTVGAGTLKILHADDRLGLTHLSTEGRASVAPGGAVDASANGGLIDLRAGGEAWLDATTGQLLFSAYSTDGRFVSSATETGTGAFVSQRSGLQRVAAFDPEHKEPLSVLAQRAPKLGGTAPALADGTALVEFSSLGMAPLFILGLPDLAVPYEIPKSTVRARVIVGPEGRPTSVTPFEGYEVLSEHVQRALATAKFPVKAAPYAVDVDVEVRPQ